MADVLGEGDELIVGVVASSFLIKKAFVSVNSAVREVFEQEPELTRRRE